jgi:hypothetical protein
MDLVVELKLHKLVQYIEVDIDIEMNYQWLYINHHINMDLDHKHVIRIEDH